MLHYKQGIMQVYFKSVSLGSDYRNALFVYVYGQQIMSLFLLFLPNLSSLPCDILKFGGDSNNSIFTTKCRFVWNSSIWTLFSCYIINSK